MKIKQKITFGIIGSMLFLPALGTAAYAATTCSSGEIVETGINPLSPVSKYEVFIDCDDNTRWDGVRKFFMPNETLGDSGYATVLTAKSLGKKVYVRLSSSRENSLIEQIRILNTDTVL